MRHRSRIRIALVALTAAVLAVAAVLATGSSEEHRFSVVVPAAANLVPGQQVNAGGMRIGRVAGVDPVDGGRAARIEFEIQDDRYWPIARDSKLKVRLGGTVSFSNQYVLLEPGESGKGTLPDGGTLPAANVRLPVEVDELIGQFTADVRHDLKRMIGVAAPSIDNASEPLNALLTRTPGLTRQSTETLQDVAGDRGTLGQLVASTARTVNAIHRSSPDLRVLIDGTAQTFDAVADKSDDLATTLRQLPAALRQTKATLAVADSTLADAGRLTDRLAPGVVELQRMAPPLSRLLTDLREVAPQASSTLRGVRRSAPQVTGLLNRVAEISPRLESIGRQAAKEVGCLRPYAPEATMFTSLWGDWLSAIDTKDHYARATLQSFLPTGTASTPTTPGQAAKRYPGLEYGFPRPPGAVAGQPWFQPQCGVGPDAVDPDKDPEARNLGPGMLDGSK